MKILFLHGWTSVPGGRKPAYLKEHGHEVFNPALPDEDFEKAVRIAQSEFDPVYLRSISEDTLAVGMLFADDEMAENKKVSDFLFYQLELSFWDLEMQQESTTKTKSDHHEKKTHPSFDPEELISNTGRTRTDMELLKQELARGLRAGAHQQDQYHEWRRPCHHHHSLRQRRVRMTGPI